MKACFKQVNNLYTPNQINVLKDFTKFLSTKLPLNNDIYITFLERKEGSMTTGVRKPGSEISVLAGKKIINRCIKNFVSRMGSRISTYKKWDSKILIK